MGLNVACFVFSDEMQIILKYLRPAEALHNYLIQRSHEHLESLDVSSNH